MSDKKSVSVTDIAKISLNPYEMLIEPMAKMANWIENQLAYKRRVLKALEAGEGGGGGVWLFPPPSRETPIFADSKSSIPIITVGNLKGGVGKSTLVANLAAGLATIGDAQKKVLIIDLDFQGSLSSMTCLDKEPLDKASALLSGHQKPRVDL